MKDFMKYAVITIICSVIAAFVTKPAEFTPTPNQTVELNLLQAVDKPMEKDGYTFERSYPDSNGYSYIYIEKTVDISHKCAVAPYFHGKVKFNRDKTDVELVEIDSININRGKKGKAKTFEGAFYINSENPNTIFWDLNGNFFHGFGVDITGDDRLTANSDTKLIFVKQFSQGLYAGTCTQGRFILRP